MLKTVVDPNKGVGALTADEKQWFTTFFTSDTLLQNNTKWLIGRATQQDSPVVKGFSMNGFPGGGIQFLSSDDSYDLSIGGNNKTVNRGVLYGFSNRAVKDAYAFGHSNRAVGENAMVMGFQSKAYDTNAIAIGSSSTSRGSNGVAIGTYANAINGSSAIGLRSMVAGASAIAFGAGALAGSKNAMDYTKNYRIWVGANEQKEQLVKHYPDLFGNEYEYDGNHFTTSSLEKFYDTVFEKNKAFWDTHFPGMKIDTVEKLRGVMEVRDANLMLQDLGWSYALSEEAIVSPIAIGLNAQALASQAIALGNEARSHVAGGVALGSFSSIIDSDKENYMDKVLNSKAPYSGVVFEADGNTVGEIKTIERLTGPVSIGGLWEGKVDNSEETQSVSYIRQIKHVADGTEDTDAVNLRQLRGALFNGINAGDGVTITKQDDPTKPDYGTITIAANGGSGGTNTGGGVDEKTLQKITNNTNSITKNTEEITTLGERVTTVEGDVIDLGNRVTTVEGDVVNLQNSMNGMNTRITKLYRRIDKVGAGSAALAALHPLDFDPDNKWDIAGGYGHYAGQSAMALGAYYRPNEDVMFSIGGAFGNGEDMINAGVSVKIGSGESKTTTSKVAMAKKIDELQEVVVTQQRQLEEQQISLAKQGAEIEALKELVKQLAN